MNHKLPVRRQGSLPRSAAARQPKEPRPVEKRTLTAAGADMHSSKRSTNFICTHVLESVCARLLTKYQASSDP